MFSMIRHLALAAVLLLTMAMLGAVLAPISHARESDRRPPQPEAKKQTSAKKTPVKKEPAAVEPVKKKDTTAVKRKTRKSTTRKSRAATKTPSAPREASVNGLPRDSTENRFIKNQVIVRYRLSANQSSMDNLVRRLDLRHEAGRTFQLAGATLHLYTIVGGTQVRDIIAALQADPTVVTAQPNYIYTLQQTTAATANDAQYALGRLGIAEVHAITRGSGVSVAVIDSGIDFSHPELVANKHISLSVTGEENPLPHKHGTSIAGILASAATLTGIAPDASIIGIRAFATVNNSPPSSTSWWVAYALDEAHENGASVINMSFAGPHDPLMEASVAGAARRGLVSVAAAGNGGPDAAPLYPAAYDEVIAVTAVDRDDVLFGGANRGDYVALSAPGVDILAPSPDAGYDVSTGTSMAAAHASGMIALMLSRKPGLSHKKIMEILDGASKDLGEPGNDPLFGHGLPNAPSALKALGI